MQKDDVPPAHKRCKSCQQIKPFEDFCKESKGKDGLKSRCRSCISTKNKEYAHGAGAEVKKANNEQYREANGEALRQKKRDDRLKKKYGDRYQDYLDAEEKRKSLKELS